MKKLLTLSAYLGLIVPTTAFAAGVNIDAIKPYSQGIINLVNQVFVPVLFAIAFLYFVWGVYKYFILGGDKENERETGREFILWSLVGFAVILSVWGLVNILMATFQLSPGGGPPNYPTL